MDVSDVIDEPNHSLGSMIAENDIVDLSQVTGMGFNSIRHRPRRVRPRPRPIENVQYITMGEIDLSEEYNPNIRHFDRNHEPMEIIDLCSPPVSLMNRHRGATPSHSCRRSLVSDIYPYFSEIRDSGTSSNGRLGLSLNALQKEEKPEANKTVKQDADKNNIIHPNKSLICAICLESYVSREPTATKCGHVFCKSCIYEAVRLTHKCPVCQNKLRSNLLLRLYM